MTSLDYCLARLEADGAYIDGVVNGIGASWERGYQHAMGSQLQADLARYQANRHNIAGPGPDARHDCYGMSDDMFLRAMMS